MGSRSSSAATSSVESKKTLLDLFALFFFLLTNVNNIVDSPAKMVVIGSNMPHLEDGLSSEQVGEHFLFDPLAVVIQNVFCRVAILSWKLTRKLPLYVDRRRRIRRRC